MLTRQHMPDMVHPAVPGFTHPYYGDLHNQKLLLPSIKNRLRPSAELLARQDALCAAAELGDSHSVQAVLMEKDITVDVNMPLPQTGLTALHYAASRGHLNIVQMLVDQCGAVVDVADRDGETALLKAAYYGHVGVVQCLIHRRTNVHHKDRDGWTALHNACARGHCLIVKILVEQGRADVNCASSTGHTPLSTLFLVTLVNAASKGHQEIVEYLLAAEDTDPLKKNVHGETAYDAAAANRMAEICDVLEDAEREWWTRPHGEAAEYTGAYDIFKLHNTVLMQLHENERAYFTFTLAVKYGPPGKGWGNWTIPSSNIPRERKQVKEPDDWEWNGDWEVFYSDFGDSEGWEYSRSFDDDEWLSEPRGKVRRRRWTRVLKRKETLRLRGGGFGETHGWESDDESEECRECQRKFTFFLRRHHCRKCGRLFCDKCTTQRAPVGTWRGAQRVCNGCYGLLQGECPVCGLLGGGEGHVAACVSAGIRNTRYVVYHTAKLVQECEICLEELEGEVCRLQCMCIFHRSCIDRWFMRSPRCPLH